jgi:ATP-dependent exoDNAse (exonuclease V) beta subunit
VLVRGRPHLQALLPRLRAAGLRFRAVDVEKLAAQPAVEALWALTRALLHRGDRVAWLALLRGPTCGLELADLLALVGDDFDTPLPALLGDPERLARLTVEGRARVVRIDAVLRPALDALGRSGLRRLVEGAWLALGGPATAGGEMGLQAAEAFLDLLARHADGGTLPDPDTFADALDKLYAPPDPEADDGLQLMTIHKAKGLEFDTVILPGLGRKTGGDRNPLLAWMEPPDGGLLMAPIDARGAVRNPLYSWIRKLESRRTDNETGRLLYVAATRARERLHLLGAADTREKEGEFTVKAPGGTFLERLWPQVGETYEALLHQGVDEDEEGGQPATAEGRSLTRLPRDWTRPDLPDAATPLVDGVTPAQGEAVIFDWAGEGARAAGTVVHRLFETWGRDGLPPEGASPPGVTDYARTALRERGLSGKPLDTASERVERAIAMTLADPRGRWLFDPDHAEARSELALTAQLDDALISLVIDRTFVDADGVRWIVDFKTSDHGGGGLDTFLDREQERYREQLERYGRVMAMLDPHPQRLALYFPLAGGWREWEPAGEA